MHGVEEQDRIILRWGVRSSRQVCGERTMQGPICKGRYQGQVGNVVARSKMVFTGFTEDWSSPATAL